MIGSTVMQVRAEDWFKTALSTLADVMVISAGKTNTEGKAQ